MKLAILFWFYKEPEICENRLQLLKKYNSDLKIFGLYGGDVSQTQEYQSRLVKYLDDFYTFASNDEDWKWLNGDLMILDWYNKRGRELDWDSVAVVQWDMLVFASLLEQFSQIKSGEVFFSGLRPMDDMIENTWTWTKPGSEDVRDYQNFRTYIQREYNYTDPVMCALFILEIFPRIFFNQYLTVKNKEMGMLEYKVPTYAKIFKIPYFQKDIGVKWYEPPDLPLNAIPKEIKREYIEKELASKNGWRIFHPYFKIWNNERNIAR
jgi:hypothetical protein